MAAQISVAPTVAVPVGAASEPLAAASAAPSEAGPLKLKPKLPLSAPEAASGVSIANWPTSDIALPKASSNTSRAPFSHPPFPVAITGTTPATPKPIHIPARGIVKAETDAPEKPEQRRAFKLGVTVTLIAAGLVLCVGGFFGWRHLTKEKSAEAHSKPSRTPTAEVPAKPSHAAPEAPKAATTPDQPANAPKVAQEEPAKQEEGPVKFDLDRPVPASPTPAKQDISNSSSPVPTTVAPGVTANMGIPISTVNASPEFRAFVATVKISGVFQGANSRAFINGRMSRVGDTIDARLGIVFEGIDPDKKQIIFKDASGAVATRKY